MNNIKLMSLLAIVTFILGACEASMPSKQGTGAVLGGVAGGIAGSQIGSGMGRDAAMVVGTLLGAALGGAVGSSMDTTDRLNAAQALSTNQQLSWNNEDTGAKYTITPQSTYTNTQGEECRDFMTTVVVDGNEEEIDGTACKQADGTWKSK
jgi:surface antigen